MASRRILRGMDDAVLIAGANLPTLLDFVFAEGKSASGCGAARGRARARGDLGARGRRVTLAALPHRRPADSRPGRRRMGTAARTRSSSCSSTTPSRRATGSRSSIAWACRRRWRCTFTSAADAIAALPKYQRGPAARPAAHGRHRDDAAARRRRGGADGERRRHSLAAGPRAAAALRLPHAGRGAASCASSRRAAWR